MDSSLYDFLVLRRSGLVFIDCIEKSQEDERVKMKT